MFTLEFFVTCIILWPQSYITPEYLLFYKHCYVDIVDYTSEADNAVAVVRFVIPTGEGIGNPFLASVSPFREQISSIAVVGTLKGADLCFALDYVAFEKAKESDEEIAAQYLEDEIAYFEDPAIPEDQRVKRKSTKLHKILRKSSRVSFNYCAAPLFSLSLSLSPVS